MKWLMITEIIYSLIDGADILHKNDVINWHYNDRLIKICIFHLLIMAYNYR